jgi:arylsulfatase B
LPAAVRGTKFHGMIAGHDWFATLCELGGVSAVDTRAAAAGLPPVDSLSMVDVLMGRNDTSPRVELALGTPAVDARGVQRGVVGGLIQWPWKLLLGDVQMGGWQGPRFPNASTDTHCFDALSVLASKEPIPCAPACLCIAHCGSTGCLFNLEDDPTEHTDVAEREPAMARRLLTRARALNSTTLAPAHGGLYNPDRGVRQAAACKQAQGANSGFWGPFMH